MPPLDDLTYDVITVLHQKAKALEAYDKYVSDAEADEDDELRDLFVAMRRQDEAVVDQLKEVLAQRLAEDLGYDDEEDEDEEYDDDDADLEEGDVEDPAATGGEAIDAVHGASSVGPSPRRGESSNRQR